MELNVVTSALRHNHTDRLIVVFFCVLQLKNI